MKKDNEKRRQGEREIKKAEWVKRRRGDKKKKDNEKRRQGEREKKKNGRRGDGERSFLFSIILLLLRKKSKYTSLEYYYCNVVLDELNTLSISCS